MRDREVRERIEKREMERGSNRETVREEKGGK